MNKETLSSNSLYHFTTKLEYLKNIILEGFKPRMCLEDFSMFNFNVSHTKENTLYEFAIPMVCFCDIPLSKIKYYTSVYGNFGIGLNKNWGLEKGISPIVYLENKSETTRLINQILDLHDNLDPNASTTWNLRNIMFRFLRFTKPYEGRLWRNKGYVKILTRFYDEREWRFVPIFKVSKNLKPWMPKIDFLDTDLVRRRNRLLGNPDYRLKFNIDDIKFIIVETQDQVLELLETLENLNYINSKKDFSILNSKFIIKSTIDEDF